MIIPLILLFLTTYYLFRFYSKTKKLPPGPTPLPMIGNFHQIAFGLLRKGAIIPIMQEWKEQYGPVFTTWIGPMATVNIADYNLAVDSMIKKGPIFADRTILFVMNIVRNGKGILVSNGQHWLEQRRFSIHTLRNFGLGKNLMQDRIMLEFEARRVILDKEIEDAGGEKSIDMFHFLERTVGNIINRILFSEPFEGSEEDEFFKIKQNVDEMMENASSFDLLIDESNYNKLPLNSRYEKIYDLLDRLLGFIRRQIKQRRAAIESGEHILRDEGEDFVDAFLIEMQRADHGDSFDLESLGVTVLDLWAAGQETTTTSLYWAFAYLSMNPEVVQKLQEELDTVTQMSRILEMSDKQNTPYLNATITEVLRVSSIAPLNFWRNTAEDTVVGNFLIPKGTAITAQLSLILNDPQRFEDHTKFIPERFLNNNEDQFVTAFGMGKRACPGESMARAEMYLILGNFLLGYNFEADPEHPASMVGLTESGTTRRAKHYKLIVTKKL